MAFSPNTSTEDQELRELLFWVLSGPFTALAILLLRGIFVTIS